MHPDPMPAPEPQPVVHVTQTPQFINQPDGTIRAYYPGDDWYVVGADRDDAIVKLHDEFDRRFADPNYVAQHFARAKRHLNGDEITPGFEVDTLSSDGYQKRMNELGEQPHTPGRHRADD